MSKDDDEKRAKRDLWPTAPTLEEFNDHGCRVGLARSDYEFVVRVWPQLTIEEKTALGFSQAAREAQIARLIEIAKKHQES